MVFYRTSYDIFTAENKEFGCLVDELLNECSENDIVTRLIFFGKPRNNEEYSSRLAVIREKVKEKFGDACPAVSYVAQRPLVGELVLEVYRVGADFEGKIEYCDYKGIHYLRIEDDEHRELVIGSLQGKNLNARILQQSDEVFTDLGELLEKEECNIHSITRQWNYIERITAFHGDHQHYQDFNDSRSHFYARTEWPQGYPAATGIGTQLGGVLVDVNAIVPKLPYFRCVPLDNALQVAAHAYSQEVLLGTEDRVFKEKTTPKFERAKAVVGAERGLVYISGTAAIRGEQSLTDVGILVQTGTTMENINYLISEENLKKAGITPEGACQLEMLRVYLKNPEDVTAVKVYMEHLFTKVPISYLLADVCRDELLIEIEGIASFAVKE